MLVYFDRLRSEQIGPLKVKPRALLRRGFGLDNLPELGILALDSPTRPNPIGLTLVRMLRRDGNRIIVNGLDFFDGTPILDIKPYRDHIAPTNSPCPTGCASWPVNGSRLDEMSDAERPLCIFAHSIIDPATFCSLRNRGAEALIKIIVLIRHLVAP